MCDQPLIVLKFGGSVLVDEQRLRIAVHEIYRWRREGWRVVAVVSALAGQTDALVAKCKRLDERPAPASQAAVIATGELEAAALLGLHLDRAGVPVRVLTPGAARFRATGHPLDATPRSVETSLFEEALARDGVVVFPGFVAVDDKGRTVTLGRGGSDLTALFLASALGANRCRLVKDVDGLYEADPATAGPPPGRFEHATYADALATDGSIIQHKAIRYARSIGLEFELGRFNGTRPTLVGTGASRKTDAADHARPLRIALLGLGTVGGGVFELLQQLPELFEVAGIAVRDPAGRACAPGTPPLTSDAAALAGAGNADVVIEVIGGCGPAADAVTAALGAGADVVTANKALMAARATELRTLATRQQCVIRASAAVGGGMPALERIAAAPIRSARGVLNGTANFVLGRFAAGATLDGAIEDARRLGFAEADSTRDLDGRDSLDKLLVLDHARHAVTVKRADHAAGSILACRGPFGDNAARWRQVASIGEEGLVVRLEQVEPNDPLYELPGEWNALDIERADGRREVIRGKGAGRWPTAESIVADALELSRRRATDSHELAESQSHDATSVSPRAVS